MTAPLVRTHTAIDLSNVRIDPSVAHRLPQTIAFRRRVVPLCRIADRVVVVTEENVDKAEYKRLLSRHFSEAIEFMAADAEAIRQCLNRVYTGKTTSADATTALPRQANRRDSIGDDAVTVCDELLQAAVLRQASDIHLLPQEKVVSIQLRVDGELELYRELPREALASVVGRFKVMADLDIAEKRAPQDGRFSIRGGTPPVKIDVRAATLPTRHGERITLRLLAGREQSHDLLSLGVSDVAAGTIRRAIELPHGLVLLTGPTGSGKSTTLYASISELMRGRHRNVLTVEDPIEYEIAGVSQVEVDSADKVSFNRALRSLLRHDPDVIMIGEIRDAETADIAIKAALTGHLVLSTLHTNNAIGVVTRLLDMGVERFLIAATLRLVVAQRLVRRLCPRCRVPVAITDQESLALQQPSLAGMTAYAPQGCVYCAGRGYLGRIALVETFSSDAEVAKIISRANSEEDLLEQIKRQHLLSLVDDAVSKITSGVTSVSEVLRAVVVSS
jgi:type II secretory ATPase GspE/PulE/Tfp pilus assembly ATPase PilB-like protein